MSRDLTQLLSVARDHASRGDWAAVRDMHGLLEGGTGPPELLLVLAEGQLRSGDPRLARPLLEGTIAAFTRLGDGTRQIRALNMLGAAHFELGALDDAEQVFAEVLDRALASEDNVSVGRATNNLGAIANIRRRHETALGLYQLAIPAFQRAGDIQGLAETHHNIAITYRDLRQFEHAEKSERRAIDYAEQVKNARLVAVARVGRAELNLLRGEAEIAQAGAQAAAAACKASRDPIGEADALRLLAASRLALGAIHEGRPPADRAVTLAAKYGNALVLAEALETRARLFAAANDRRRARMDAQQAIGIYHRLDAHSESRDLVRWMQEANI